MRHLGLVGATLALCVFAHRAMAQSIETPVAFDSAQRLVIITPALVERLGLTQPVWPITGEYRDVRLYRIDPTGGFVLVASRVDGAFERFPLRDDQVAALRAAINAAVALAGRPVGELASAGSEPAGNTFARHLTLLSGLVYAPVAASLASTPSGAGALYLAVTGGTFFISYSAAQSERITRARSDLAVNLGVATGLAGWGAGYAATGNSDRGVRAVALGSAIVGTVAGASLGRGMTDAEAQGAMAGMETVAAAAWAASSAAGAGIRAAAGFAAASEVVGFPLGVSYPRHAKYRVTAGDVNALQTTALIGTLYGAAVTRKDARARELGIALGSTYAAGALLGDLVIARPFDLTTSEANIGTVGAIAGGLIGLAIPVLARSDDNTLVFGAAAAGATLGFSAALGIANPLHAPRMRLSEMPVTARQRSATAEQQSRLQLRVTTACLVGLIQRRPGAYPLVRITF
ncbi:MAG TPA: hypothetical protein VL383_04630 [Gemmatimonadaceae bacterium]|nr:hypothetical protein [Gemmatimonadaceae bacterium]